MVNLFNYLIYKVNLVLLLIVFMKWLTNGLPM